MTDIKGAVQSQFGQVAGNYRTSQVHAAGDDLQQIVALVQQQTPSYVLDVGCGAGHTSVAVAPYSPQVVALDLTPAMLEQVSRLATEQNIGNIETRLGDIEQLPFEENTFDCLVSRYSAHHWADPQTALHECRRVLKPGGRFILADTVSPEAPALDTFLQALELLRDQSHVRDHCPSQWQSMFERAGFTARVVFTWSVALNFNRWVERMATPLDRVQVLQSLFESASSEIREAFQIGPDYNFALPGAIFEAE